VQEVKWDMGGTEPAGDSMEMGMRNMNQGQDDINLLEDNENTIRKNREDLLNASKLDDLEMSIEEIKYKF
jgi:hypothetical protein